MKTQDPNSSLIETWIGEGLFCDCTKISTNKTPTVTGKQVEEGAQLIGLYFSAHWCPPCTNSDCQLARPRLHA